MTYETRLPEHVPEPGYYYHYKHDPSKGVRDYAYYLYGVGHHTEDDCRPEDANVMVYRPLYEDGFVYKNGRLFDIRPLHMFFEKAAWQGTEVTRFTKIEDPQVIATLTKVRGEMYPEA
jgi:hypothetical protein